MRCGLLGRSPGAYPGEVGFDSLWRHLCLRTLIWQSGHTQNMVNVGSIPSVGTKNFVSNLLKQLGESGSKCWHASGYKTARKLAGNKRKGYKNHEPGEGPGQAFKLVMQRNTQPGAFRVVK